MNDCRSEGDSSVQEHPENESRQHGAAACPMRDHAAPAVQGHPAEAAPRSIIGMALLMGLGLAIMLYGLFHALAAIWA